MVIDTMGEDYDYAEGKSCAYDGLDKTYGYEMAAFYTNSLKAGDIVMGVDDIITHYTPGSITDQISNRAYRHDLLTDFLEEMRAKGKFRYWLFGHYDDNRVLDDRRILLWEQIVQVFKP